MVTQFVDIHTHEPLGGKIGMRSVRLGVDNTEGLGGAVSVGVHPWDVGIASDIVDQLRNIDCMAIGEVGLDRMCDADFALQMQLFEQQIAIASARHLPLIIHSVKAQQEIVKILSSYPTLIVIFHGFIGSLQQAEQLWKLGHYTSFGFGALRSPKTVEALRMCPSDRLFLETDVDVRDIALLYEEVARLKGVAVEELNEDINNNYKRIFD